MKKKIVLWTDKEQLMVLAEFKRLAKGVPFIMAKSVQIPILEQVMQILPEDRRRNPKFLYQPSKFNDTLQKTAQALDDENPTTAESLVASADIHLISTNDLLMELGRRAAAEKFAAPKYARVR